MKIRGYIFPIFLVGLFLVIFDFLRSVLTGIGFKLSPPSLLTLIGLILITYATWRSGGFKRGFPKF